jgi:hypothetical protein
VRRWWRGQCAQHTGTEHTYKTHKYKEEERRIMLQYWNSGSPAVHKVLGVTAERREGKVRGRGGG